MGNAFMTCIRTAVLTGLLLTVITWPARASEIAFEEVRVGVSWLNPNVIQPSTYSFEQFGFNAELLTTPMRADQRIKTTNRFVRELLSPRLHFGGIYDPNRYGVSSFYAGLTWRHRLRGKYFVETSFGGAVHDGKLRKVRISGIQSGFGSRLLFRESIALGIEISENKTLLLQLSHQSHAGLGGRNNDGQTDINLKFGMKF